MRIAARYAVMGCVAAGLALRAAGAPIAPPTHLRCDALDRPLGDDHPNPLLSWELQDGRIGARQTAYRIQVASSPAKLVSAHPDIWDSGKVESSQTVAILYNGPALQAGTRYYWHVQVWDMRDRRYPVSDASWWETGLMSQAAWQARWIGYEDPEQRSVREAEAKWITNAAVPDYKAQGVSRHDFRLTVNLPSPVRHATLYVTYVTGEDTAAAWINGAQVVEASQEPAWGRTPWRTYTHADVTQQLRAGANLLAIEITHFQSDGNSQTPMSATLFVEDVSGSIHRWESGDSDWKAALGAPEGWQQTGFDDGSWAAAVNFPPPQDAFGGTDTLGDPVPTAAVSALRRSFHVDKPIASARLYATALGAYRFWLNGRRVGDQVLSPGWTDFREKVFYQTYDVTSLLKQGEDALGAWLAPGWYSTPLEWIGQGNNYGRTANALLAELKITFADGSVQWIVTDSSWKADLSPIRFAEIYDGETYDARLEQPGWNWPGFRDALWHPAQLIRPQQPAIVWQSFPPIRAEDSIPAKTLTNPKPGVYIYDFGQDLAGVARFRLDGSAGSTVQLRFGERLNPDGTLYVANLRNAKATDRYTFVSTGTAEYQPFFTFHGFRYMEVTGVRERPAPDAVQAIVLHTDAPQTAILKTGSPLINQLWSNILWGQRSNFIGVPTDCPQRDERLGWAADAQVFWRTASYNMDVTTFSRKYSADLRGTQNNTGMYGIYAPGTSKENPGFGPGWSDAGIIVPWTSWIQNGDSVIVRQNWDAMQAYLAAILADNPDHLWKKKQGIAFGDWLAPEGTTSEDLLATAYWAWDVSRMEQMAHALARVPDEQRYAELFEKIRTAFQKQWVHPGGLVGAPPEKGQAASNSGIVETQTGYVLALAFRLVPDDMRAAASDRLLARLAANGWKLGTGFLGTPYLLQVLSDTGHADIAYRLLMNTDYPSWGYMVTHGATTMWERWNGDKMIRDPGMNSFNHYAYGAVGEWIYRYAAGVDASAGDPGFHTILLHPHFDHRLCAVDFSYASRYGAIHSAWIVRSGQIDWKITIPPNTNARVELPGDRQGWKINGRAFSESPLVRPTAPGAAQAAVAFQLEAGTYTIILPDSNATD